MISLWCVQDTETGLVLKKVKGSVHADLGYGGEFSAGWNLCANCSWSGALSICESKGTLSGLESTSRYMKQVKFSM